MVRSVGSPSAGKDQERASLARDLYPRGTKASIGFFIGERGQPIGRGLKGLREYCPSATTDDPIALDAYEACKRGVHVDEL